ncbi:MAG: Mur ligase family protein, partial [Deinococcales bacterium]
MATLARALELHAPDRLVHVVGTNGKGTVTAMIDEGLRAWGYSSGRFVSPHVEDFRERIAVDGRPVSRETVRHFVARAAGLELDPSPAFFEWTLALALSAFARAGVEWAVIEAGVGGAHDATRALGPVELVVLTNVGLDHLETLGPDLASIARDKAGAFRPGVPAITGARGEALMVVALEARRVGAPLYVARPGDPLFTAPSAGR